MYCHWSCRSSDSDVLLPAHRSSTDLRAMTKPMPGGPSTHLPEAAMSASNGIVRASIGKAPNELIASTIRLLPCFAHHLRNLSQRIKDAGRRLAVDRGRRA